MLGTEAGSSSGFTEGDAPEEERPSLEVQAAAAQPEVLEKPSPGQADTIRRNLGTEGETAPTLEQALGRFENIQNEALKTELNGLFDAVNTRYKLDQERLLNPDRVEQIKDFISKIGDKKVWRNVTIGGIANFATGWIIGAKTKMVGRKLLYGAGVKGVVAAAAIGAAYGGTQAGWRKSRETAQEYFGIGAWEKQLAEHKDNPEEQMSIIRTLLADPHQQKYLKANSAEAVALMGRFQEVALTLEKKTLDDYLQNRAEGGPKVLAEYLDKVRPERRTRILKAIGKGAVWGALTGLAGFGLGHFFHGASVETQGNIGDHHGDIHHQDAPSREQSAAGIPKFVAPVTEPSHVGTAGEPPIPASEPHSPHLYLWHNDIDPSGHPTGLGHLEYDTKADQFAQGNHQWSLVKIENSGSSAHSVASEISRAVKEVAPDMTSEQKMAFDDHVARWLQQHHINESNLHVGQEVKVPASEINEALRFSHIHINEEVIKHFPEVSPVEPVAAPTTAPAETPHPPTGPTSHYPPETPAPDKPDIGESKEGLLPPGASVETIPPSELPNESGSNLAPGMYEENIPAPREMPEPKIPAWEKYSVAGVFGLITGIKAIDSIKKNRIELNNEYLDGEFAKKRGEGKRAFLQIPKKGEVEIIGKNDDPKCPVKVSGEKKGRLLSAKDLRKIEYRNGDQPPLPPPPIPIPPPPPPAEQGTEEETSIEWEAIDDVEDGDKIEAALQTIKDQMEAQGGRWKIVRKEGEGNNLAELFDPEWGSIPRESDLVVDRIDPFAQDLSVNIAGSRLGVDLDKLNNIDHFEKKGGDNG